MAEKAFHSPFILKQPPEDNTRLRQGSRATRACDSCRLKKLKCDSQLPCRRCQLSFSDCTYDLVRLRKRRRTSQTQQSTDLEARLHRLEALVQTALPQSSDTANGMDQAQATGLQTSLDTSVRATGTTPNSGYKTVNNDSLIDDMVAAFGRIWLDDTGKCTYNGASSAVSFLESFRRRFGDEHIPAMRAQLPIAEYALPKLFSTAQFLPDWKDELIVLPPQDIALKLSRAVFDEACILTHFIHQPTFLERLKLIYSKTLHQYCEEDRKFLPLFYAMLALGSLFEPGQLIGTGFQAAIHKGIEYLVTSRRLIDPECRDLLSLQAMTLITMFLMCTVRTSTSYSYVGTLVRLAFQLGLHRSFPSPSDIILRESRIRTFWVIRSMDVYVGLMVGLPKAINDEDIDQSMPTDVCDEYIRPDTILCMPEGKVSRVSGLIAYTGLLPIMGKIVRNVYPTRFEGTNNESGGYLVSDAKIHDIERDLEAWRESLKPELRIDYPASSKTVERIQYTLWMSFCYLQLMLYHPFVQSLSNPDSGIPKDARSRGYAAKCESVSLNVIKIGKHMLRRGTLGGAPWFPVNIICFAIQTLVLPATNSRDSTASKKILKEMETGRATIASLKTRYESADRCSRILDILFSRLRDSSKDTINGPQYEKRSTTEELSNGHEYTAAETAEAFEQELKVRPSSGFPISETKCMQPISSTGPEASSAQYEEACILNPSNMYPDEILEATACKEGAVGPQMNLNDQYSSIYSTQTNFRDIFDLQPSITNNTLNSFIEGPLSRAQLDGLGDLSRDINWFDQTLASNAAAEIHGLEWEGWDTSNNLERDGSPGPLELYPEDFPEDGESL